MSSEPSSKKKLTERLNDGIKTWNNVQTGYRLAKEGVDWYRRRNQYTLHVEPDSHLYGPALALVGDNADCPKVMTLMKWYDYSEDEYRVSLAAAEGFTYKFEWRRHKLIATVANTKKKLDEDLELQKAGQGISIICPGKEARQELADYLATTVDRTPSPSIFAMTQFGMERTKDIPKRDISTVVLRKGVLEGIMEDLQRFAEAEDKYKALGIPYHRGYLLYGPPGTGKTSLVSAIASDRGMSLYSISLNDTKSDAELIAGVSGVNKMGRGILLLEDVDIAGSTKEGLSIGALLNVLDGMNTPHGLITIMTSNFPEEIPKALLRPGRVDQEILIDLLDDEQLGRLVHTITGEHVALPPIAAELSPATVIGMAKDHINDLSGFVPELKKLLEEM